MRVDELLERIAPPSKWFDGTNLPLGKAFQIGLCQVFSIIPGVSRSGATILGGELLGVDRRAATLFTFYLAVPTMLGASILELHHKGAGLSHGQELNIAIGFVVSFVVAFFVIRGFLQLSHGVGIIALGAIAWFASDLSPVLSPKRSHLFSTTSMRTSAPTSYVCI